MRKKKGKNFCNTIFYVLGNGRRGRGRPSRWIDEVVGTTGLQLQQLKEAARDRVGWRDVVRDFTRGRLRPDGTR